MHVIVKKGVETKLRELIKSLQSDLTYIESQDVEKVTKEDLDYFYEMREIVNRRIEPAVKDMQNANSRRQQNLLQGILCLGNPHCVFVLVLKSGSSPARGHLACYLFSWVDGLSLLFSSR